MSDKYDLIPIPGGLRGLRSSTLVLNVLSLGLFIFFAKLMARFRTPTGLCVADLCLGMKSLLDN